jgi:transglutaminase-like putative cysteine protease
MFRLSLCLVVLLYVPPGQLLRGAQDTPAKKAEPKTLLESWQAAYFEGLKVGHVHTLARETMQDGKKIIRTVMEMRFVIKRYGEVIPVRLEQVSFETEKGKVLALRVTQYIGKDTKKTMSGEVKGDKLVLTNSGDDTEVVLPWDDKAIGFYAQQILFQKKKVKSGDRFSFVAYELQLPGVMTQQCIVKDQEKTDRLVQKKDGKTVKVVRDPATLQRVETVPDKIEVNGIPIQLPSVTYWLDSKLMPVRQQSEIPGLGAITLYNTTKEAALKEGVAPELLPDFGLKISIPVKQTIDNPYETTEAVYRITLTDKVDHVFAEDGRQAVRDKKDKTFELVVKAIRKPAKVEDPIKVGEEYLQSNQFIDSDHAGIQATAKKVVGKETNSWQKALKLEKWVHDNMKMNNAVGFPTAGQISRNMEGDCRQHAILLTALCRAAGIPARTAIGLIYVRDAGRSPFFGFHMWTEVAIDGQWLGLDAILGEGGIGATHLKMGHHSWSKTVTLAPLLPVSQVLGKLSIEVVRSK